MKTLIGPLIIVVILGALFGGIVVAGLEQCKAHPETQGCSR